MAFAVAYSSQSRFTLSEERSVAKNIFFSCVAHAVDGPVRGLVAARDALLFPTAVVQLLIGCITAVIQQSAQELQSFLMEVC